MDQQSFSGRGHLGLSLWNAQTGTKLNYIFYPKGRESMAGNLFGFVIEETQWSHRETIESKGFNGSILLDDRISFIQKIIGMGEVAEYEIEDLSTFGFWFGENTPAESVWVKKRTLDVIGFLLSDNAWIYLVAEGENYYSLYFRSKLPPAVFIEEQGYPAMERNIVILEEIG